MNTIQGIAYAEFHVEDLPKAAAHLVEGYGFTVEGAADPGTQEPLSVRRPPEQGVERIGLRSGAVRLVVSSAGDPRHPVARFARRHGDGVAVIAISCQDPEFAYEHALANGARPDPSGGLTIAGFGDSALRFVPVEPAALPANGAGPAAAAVPEPLGMLAIDHVAVCVPSGSLAATVEFCEQALNLRRIFGDYIKVGSQGMDSVVMQSESGAVTFTILEPDAAAKPGQIDEFLDGHGGAGVQHLALLTGDIAGSVRGLGERGVDFLVTPPGYYDALTERFGRTGIALETLRDLNILVDQDHGGQLFQIFTRSVHARRTYFFELIERRGASTFGTANITALYEAVERQQTGPR